MNLLQIKFLYMLGTHCVEAVSLTCDNTTGVCPGTEVTCTCSLNSTMGLTWTLPPAVPGSETIPLDSKVGSKGTNGIFCAVITNNNTGVLESMLIYNATESLVNDNIKCEGVVGQGGIVMSTTITVTLAG